MNEEGTETKAKRGRTVERTLLALILAMQVAILIGVMHPRARGPADGASAAGGNVARHESPASRGGAGHDTRPAGSPPAGDSSAAIVPPAGAAASWAAVPSWPVLAVPRPGAMPRDVNALWAQAMSEFEEMDNFLRHLDDGWSLAATLPAGDMREEADRYVVLFSMPGLSRSNTTVTLEGRLLTVSINVTDQARSYANSYGFSLPGPVKDGAHAEAVLSNGVLRVVIPKGRREESKGPRLSSLF